MTVAWQQQPGDEWSPFDASVEPSPETDVQGVLEDISRSRNRIERVREYLDGDRPGTKVPPKDWITAMDRAREETDVALCLFGSDDHPESPDSCWLVGVDADLCAVVCSWSEVFGTSGVRYVPRSEAEDRLLDAEPEILVRSEGVTRFRDYVSERAGGDRDV